MKFLKGKRIFEGNALIFGKGLWLKILADYGTTIYVLSFTISNVFDVGLTYHVPSSYNNAPKWELDLSVLGKKLIDTAKTYHESLHIWVEQDRLNRQAKAKIAKEKLEQQDLLDQAKAYTSGWYLLRD